MRRFSGESICSHSRRARSATGESPLAIVPSKATFPDALPTRAATWVEPRSPVRVRSGARRRVPLRGRMGLPRRRRRVVAARLPGRDDHDHDDRDRGQRDEHDVRLDPPVPALRARCRAAWPRLVIVRGADEARVVLVDVQLAVEAEVLGVGAQEALDVGLRRQHVELLLLERAQVLAADLGRKLGLREVEAPAHARFPEAVANLEHGPRSVAATCALRLLRPAKRAVHGERQSRRHPDVQTGPGEAIEPRGPGPSRRAGRSAPPRTGSGGSRPRPADRAHTTPHGST